KIADALADIARVVDINKFLPQFLQLCWKVAPESIVKVTIGKTCKYMGKTIEDIEFRSTFGVDVIALRRNNTWILNETETMKLGDHLIVKGDLNALKEIKVEFNDPEPFSFIQDQDPSDLMFPPDNKEVLDIMMDLKRKYIEITDFSETMVDLALAALFFGNEEIAEDIMEMEEIMDQLVVEFEKNVLWAAKSLEKPYSLVGIIRIIYSCELISDAAANIAENLLKGFKPHNIIADAINESDETVVRAYVTEKSYFNGKTYEHVQVPKYMRGFHIIAVKRDDWIYSLKPDFTFRVDDLLIGLGPVEQIEAWRMEVDPEFDEDDFEGEDAE
nr:TrkA C-terminal domain-containing protein [Candidatus Sigynarchaeota archaeon]